MSEYPQGEKPSTSESGESLRINSIVIPADDEQSLRQAEVSAEDLEERQQLVGGLIQAVDLDDPAGRLYCNEEGKALELAPNKRATLLLWAHNPRFRYLDFIVGDAFLVGPVSRTSTDSSVSDRYVTALFEARRFRVEVRSQGEDQWREHPERFDDWVTAYEHAVGWSGGLARHQLEVRVVPEE